VVSGAVSSEFLMRVCPNFNCCAFRGHDPKSRLAVRVEKFNWESEIAVCLSAMCPSITRQFVHRHRDACYGEGKGPPEAPKKKGALTGLNNENRVGVGARGA
jgi:hypothetical protein